MFVEAKALTFVDSTPQVFEKDGKEYPWVSVRLMEPGADFPRSYSALDSFDASSLKANTLVDVTFQLMRYKSSMKLKVATIVPHVVSKN